MPISHNFFDSRTFFLLKPPPASVVVDRTTLETRASNNAPRRASGKSAASDNYGIGSRTTPQSEASISVGT